MNALPCGRCANWQGPIETHEKAARPLGYCKEFGTFRFQAETVDECTEALDARSQQASDAK